MPDEVFRTRQKRGIFFYADFNLIHLLQLAERLRGRPCTCDDSQTPKAGAYNWVVFLAFDDGVEWVFRAPSSAHAPAEAITERLLASEAATLKYIREHTTIPVPEVFHYKYLPSNPLSVSCSDGRKLHLRQRHRYSIHPHEQSFRSSPCHLQLETHPHQHPGSLKAGRAITDEEKKKIMRQLGCYACQLFDLCFPTIGSLLEGDQGYYIGECLSPGHIFEDRGTIEDMPRGPFHDEADYYASLATALRLHAEQLPMGYHVLRVPISAPQEYSDIAVYHDATACWNNFVTIGGLCDSSANRLQYCLASQLLQDSVIPSMVRPATTRPLVSGFPLYHHDISIQNLFVDHDMNITSFIDWAFSSTVPPAQVLAPPGLPHPRDLVLDVPVASAFRSGFEAENEKSSKRFLIDSDDWRRGEMVSRFMRLVNQDALQDYHHLEALCLLVRGDDGDDDDGDNDGNSLAAALVTRATTADARALADELAADDEPESAVRQREKRYFNVCGAQRRALAHKVALAAEMNPQFVADARLWRWVAAVLEDCGGLESGSGRPGMV